MDKNNTEININELDVLGRKEFVDNSILLIDTIYETTKSAFVMIDGKWGVGKSYVMNMLEKKLKNNYSVINYNCWENSYYKDPLEAILSIMQDYNNKGKIWNDENAVKFNKLANMLLLLLSFGNLKIIKTIISFFNNRLNKKEDYNVYTIIEKTRFFLKNNNQKIVILVDELDRCLPEYGIKTLERLYLLFKYMPNFVLIIANNKKMMDKSIKNVFGYDSIDEYLKKFIDYTLKLETIEKYENREIIETKYQYYFNLFSLSGRYFELFNYLFFGKDIRHIENAIETAYKLHTIIFEKEKEEDYLLMAELLIVELKEKAIRVIKTNYAKFDEYYPKFEKYKKEILDGFIRNELFYEQDYKCFFYLDSIDINHNNKIFDKQIVFNKTIHLKLKKFYELVLLFE